MSLSIMQDIAVVERFLTSLHVSSFLGPGRPMSGGRGHRCAGQSIVREELKYSWCALPSISLLFLLLSHSHSFFATGKPSQLVACVHSFIPRSFYSFFIYPPRRSLPGRSGHERLERVFRGCIHEMAEFVDGMLRCSRGWPGAW
jgi:hypothetical protein